MESMELQVLKEQAVWTAHTLFDRNKTSGTTANISFLINDTIYISRSGSCFGTLKVDDFVAVSLNSDVSTCRQDSNKPSKELELHRILYQTHPEVTAVIHTHAPYATLWSCLKHKADRDVIPWYTPYLSMKLGSVALVPYAPPGSEELFNAFQRSIGVERGYLLQNHGPIVGGKTMMNAFEAIEELEQSVWIAWNLLNRADASKPIA